MHSTSIGIREAKIHLSKLLKMVQKGKEVILTDRGRPVGKIVPISSEKLGLPDRIRRLEDHGFLEPRSKKVLSKIPQPIHVPDDIAQRFLREDREIGT